MVVPRYGPIVQSFRRWADEDPDVRAALVVGSQARTDLPADAWSDLDVVVFHTDPRRLLASTDWFGRFGAVVLSVVEPTAVLGGLERRVLYSEGRDVDFSVFPSEAIPLIAASREGLEVLRRGYVVLLDKDQQLAKLRPVLEGGSPERRGLPTEERFQAGVADFWYHVLWTAKKLRRGELWSAKLGCDGYLKRQLAEMIEWQTLAVGEGVDVWHEGRFLDRWADAAVRRRLPATFGGYEPRDLSRALRETGRLYSELARQVAGAQGWTYPADAEATVLRAVADTLGDLGAPA